MKDLLGYEICRKIERTSFDRLERIFSPDNFKIEWDDRLPLLFSAHMAFYAINVLKIDGQKDLIIDVYSPGERMFLTAVSKQGNIYRKIDGMPCRFIAAVLNQDDDVLIVYADDNKDILLVEYRPLLTIGAKHDHDSLRYIMEKQYAFDYLNTVLNSCFAN